MPENEELMKQMDEAAVAAEAELVQGVNSWSAKDLIAWWARSYMKAGHKRLGRVLVAQNKKLAEKTEVKETQPSKKSPK